MNKKKKLKVLKKYWQLYLILLPMVVHLIIFDYVPMYGVTMAFQDYKAKLGLFGSEWVGLKHFIRFLTYPDCWVMVKNTLALSLYSLLTFPVDIIVALLINEIGNTKFKKTVQMITYAPHFLSTVVACSIVGIMVGREGPLGILYQFFTGESANLLAKPEWFGTIYVWSGVWQNVGWGTIIYLAALSGISQDLVESAKIDGAGRLRVIWHINLPGIMPTVIIMLIMRFGGLMRSSFEKIFLLQNPLNQEVSRVISTYTYQLGIMGGQFSYSTAIGFLNNVVNITLLVIANKVARKVSGMGLW